MIEPDELWKILDERRRAYSIVDASSDFLDEITRECGRSLGMSAEAIERYLLTRRVEDMLWVGVESGRGLV